MRACAAFLSPPRLIGLALAIGACGSTDETTPVACLEGSKAYLQALEQAPDSARLKSGTRISDCLKPRSPGAGERQPSGAAIGEGLDRARLPKRGRTPAGPAALRVGCLLGAAERGAEDTAGIHAELIGASKRRPSTARQPAAAAPLSNAQRLRSGPDHRLRRGCPGPGAGADLNTLRKEENRWRANRF